MQFVSFTHGGSAGFGAIKDGGIVALDGRMSGGYPTLKALIAAGAVADAHTYVSGSVVDYALDAVELLPVVPDPGKIICVGVNYQSHRIETNRPVTQYPTLFTRFASSQAGHGQPMIKPRGSDSFDFEGELALVIGKTARHVSADNAMAHVFGYACYNDGSIRDWQRHTSQFTPGKNFLGTGGFGPALVTADEVPDYTALQLTTRLNGQVVQDASLSDLIFTIPQIIEYCSIFTALEPGDVIVTGTPGGVGERREPPLYMKAGDVVEVDIPGVGLLRNSIVAEA